MHAVAAPTPGKADANRTQTNRLAGLSEEAALAARFARRPEAPAQSPRRSLKPYLAAAAFFIAAAGGSAAYFLNYSAGLNPAGSAHAAPVSSLHETAAALAVRAGPGGAPLTGGGAVQLVHKQGRLGVNSWAAAVETFRLLSGSGSQPAKAETPDNERLLQQLEAWQNASKPE